MAFFNEFPHTRTYDSDLGWVIKRINEQQEQMDGQAEYMETLKTWMDENEPKINDIEYIYNQFIAGNLPQPVVNALENWLNEYGVLAAANEYTDSRFTSLSALLAAETEARENGYTILQTQIDQIIAPGGEAPSPAEITNARIGFNGTVYNTLGEAIRDQIGDNRNALRSNALDVIAFCPHPSTTSNGVTYTYDQLTDSYTITGTATNTSFINFHNDSASLPYSVEAGEKYYAEFYGENVSFRVFAYINGTATELTNSRYNTYIEIPTGTTGVSLRLNVASGTSIGETVKAPKLTKIFTNKKIENRIIALEDLTVRDIIADLPNNHNNINETNVGGLSIRWSENGDSISFTGTTNTLTVYNIFASNSTFPDGIEPGKTYYIEYTSANVGFEVLIFTSNTAFYSLINTKENAQITIPTNAQGLYFRFNIPTGTITNETVQTPKVLSAMTNQALTDSLSIQLLPNNSDANNIKDGIYIALSGNVYTNLPENVGFLESRTYGNVTWQRFTAFACRDVYNRRALNTVWESWYHVTGINNKVSLAMFGDSITWGRDGSSTGRVAETLPMIVGRYSRHIATTNFGVGSMGWLERAGSPSRNAIETVQATDLSNFDAVSYAYGVNDWNYPLGTYLDTGTSTIMGQIYNTFQYVENNYPGKIQILIGIANSCLHTEIGFPEWDWYRTRDGGWSDESFDTECRKFCDYYHVNYISFKQSPISAWNITNYLGDGIHPTQAGYYLIGDYMRSQLENILGG